MFDITVFDLIYSNINIGLSDKLPSFAVTFRLWNFIDVYRCLPIYY